MSNLDGLNDEDPGQDAGGEAETELVDDEQLGEAPAEVDDAPAYEYVTVDDPDNQYVQIKIDGEDVDVPFSEALSGYSRQQDYTRKTQELAQQRAEAEDAIRTHRALQNDPGLTMQVLARQAGVSVEEFLGMSPRQQEVAADTGYDEDEYVDPVEKQLRQSNSRVDALEQRLANQDADRALRQATDDLKRQHGATDEDVLEVVNQAIHMKVGMDMFPLLFMARRDQKSQAGIQAQAQSDEQRGLQTAGRRKAANNAGRQVGTGTGAAGSSVTKTVNPDKPMTIREAALAAFSEHGDI